MPTTKLYLDARRAKTETALIKVGIYDKKKVAYITLDMKIPIAPWDAEAEVLRGKEFRSMNKLLVQKREEVAEAIKALQVRDELTGLSVIEIRDKVLAELGKGAEETDNKNLFLARFEAYRDACRTNGTRSVYEQTHKKIVAFDPNAHKLTFENLTKSWLEAFDTYLSKTIKSQNAKSIHFRNIRTVINQAIDDEITTAYPFRKFKIRSEETAKRCLSVEQLRFFANCEVADWQERYRDLFMLMFMLCGINIGDLCLLEKVENGRINYRRQKTHKLYSIKVEPEAQALIDKYRGSDYLLNILDNYGQYQDFNRRLKHAMDKIIADINLTAVTQGRSELELPPISSYWARHTWATIAADLDIPIETISAALGHSYGCATTAIYIKFNQRKVDEANRKVLDWVLYGIRDGQKVVDTDTIKSTPCEPQKRRRGRPRKVNP